MDTITQAALGAAIGQAGFRHLGRRAMLFGAFCGLMPDFDVVLGSGWEGLVTHRGSSHSLLVLPVVALPLGLAAWRLLGRRGAARSWVHLAFWALITHPLLDVCTTYGTQLLAPVSRRRFAFDAVAIIDPLYTFPLLLALLLGFRKKVKVEQAARPARLALSWGLLYLGLGLLWSQASEDVFEERLKEQGFTPVELRATTPMLFPMLRHGVAKDAEGRIAVGTIVAWAPERTTVQVLDSLLVEPMDPRARAALESEHGRILDWFSDGLLSARLLQGGDIVFADHRYGMFTDPASTPFQAVLPGGAPPEALELRGPGGGERRNVDIGAEIDAGWALVKGNAQPAE